MFDYICGERNGFSHAWLRKGGIIIDITGNQFSDFSQGVYVGKENNFYKDFKIVDVHSASIMQYDEGTRNEIECFYRKIISKNTDGT